jgi:hypothetical protein
MTLSQREREDLSVYLDDWYTMAYVDTYEEQHARELHGWRAWLRRWGLRASARVRAHRAAARFASWVKSHVLKSVKKHPVRWKWEAIALADLVSRENYDQRYFAHHFSSSASRKSERG